MSRKNKLILPFLIACNLSLPSFFITTSCNKSDEKTDKHVSCTTKEKSSTGNITYFLDLDLENYSIDDFDVSITEKNGKTLSIVKKK